MFNLAIDSKLRGCDVVALKVEDIAPNGYALVHATTAHRINQGSIPDLSPPGTDSDFYFVQAEEPEAAVARIIELVKTRIPRRFRLDPVRDIQVLCPNEPRRGRRSHSQPRTASSHEPGRRTQGRAFRLDLRARRAP
jgi:hypothetical protein